MKYYTSYGNQEWESCKAKSLNGAKRVALKRNPYLDRTGVCVGIERVDFEGNEVVEGISKFHFGNWIN